MIQFQANLRICCVWLAVVDGVAVGGCWEVPWDCWVDGPRLLVGAVGLWITRLVSGCNPAEALISAKEKGWIKDPALLVIFLWRGLVLTDTIEPVCHFFHYSYLLFYLSFLVFLGL